MAAHTHDAYFKKMLSHPRIAADALRRVLDPALIAAIDWDRVELLPTDFINDDLSSGRADLVFRVRLHGKPAFVFVLYEHQSSVDPMMPFRVLVYMVRIWQGWLRENPNARHLPPIVPAVLYNGRRRWNAPLHLHGLFRIAPPLLDAIGRFLPSFEVALDDLARTDDAEIERSTRTSLATITLMMLKHAAHDPAFDSVVERLSDHLVAAASEPGGVEALVSTLYYAYENSDLRRGVIEELIAPHLDPKAREVLVSTAQKLREEGRVEGLEEGLEKGREEGLEKGLKKGLEKGRVEGRTEGKASLVQAALRFKFGELPYAVLSRVQSADANHLDRWHERIFVAQSLDDVFAD